MADASAGEVPWCEIPDQTPFEKDNLSPEKILEEITESFGKVVGDAFQEQDATHVDVIKDLVKRDADSCIFQRLKMSYGQAVRFKAKFSYLFPPEKEAIKSGSMKDLPPPLKPTMGQLSSLDPAVKCLYLSKRKQVGMLATAHWKNSFPKFNTPQKRIELVEFASSIAEECSVPAAGFNKEGIAKHIQDYFNEQRDIIKKGNWITPTVLKKPCEKMVISDCKDGESQNNQDDSSENESLPSTISARNSDNDENDSLQDSQSPPCTQSDVLNDPKLTPKACKKIIKAVCGKILDREETVKLLKSKFGMPARSLTSLTPSQLLEVASKKLLKGKYVEIPHDINPSELSKSVCSLTVKKEIEL
ncbi:Hypothetical predicted protein [Paramuricea clavata]|uniref:Uncharacterized protein n=1 Tax=Paramuricea clavata TaxID=317549 RepID=A0A6S7GGG0_PARCT|nr:Hypothetical predicted protein [Paramuricea clavata]